jgi:TolB protein
MGFGQRSIMSARIAVLIALIFGITLPFLHTQEPPITIRPRASEEIILAVADVQPATAARASEISDVLKTFNQVLRDDLSFSGFFAIAGKSFYPPQPIVHPETDLNYDAWNTLPFKVSFLTAGTLTLTEGSLRLELSVYDMKQRKWSFGRRYVANVDQSRTIAHWWADEVVYKLTAGASRGIASTKIAYVTRKGNAKEIYVMDYDGNNPQAFTHNGALNLFPNWSPDNSKLAFVSFRTGKPEVNIYSYTDGSRLAFPMFNTFASTPAISPDGTEVAFALRTPRGDADLFISKLDGSNRHNITNNPAIDSSPTWSPSGLQIAYESGLPSQIHICDADGSNVRRIVKEGGDAVSPAWSPDGKWLAFQWKPHLGTHYDLFLAEVGSGAIRQLTNNRGSNEFPSWAPDGRHLVFQSNRSGSSQIYIMLLGDSEPRMVTTQGSNTTPAWSGYFRRNADD